MLKRVKINVGSVGLVFRGGDYQRVITAGVYWVFIGDDIRVYNCDAPFYPPINLEILLRDEQLRSLLQLVEVKDGQLAVVYENGNFKTILSPGRHLYWKVLTTFTFQILNLTNVEILEPVSPAVLERPELARYLRVFVVEDYEAGMLFIDGQYVRDLPAGTYYFWKNSTPVKVVKADRRSIQLEVSGQEMLTGDKAALRINFVVRYRVADMEKALVANKDYEKQLYVLVQLALREFMGAFTLDEILEKKGAISDYVMETLRSGSATLGVQVQHCGVRDIILPGEMKEIMNQVLIAQKRAQANVIMRREETASTRSLLNTAKLMEDNEMLFRLKEMEYMEKIAEKIGEITVSGNGQVLDQLKGIFTPIK